MHRNCLTSTLLITLTSVWLATAGAAQVPRPAGAEFQINLQTVDNQRQPAVTTSCRQPPSR